jgi:hypothetical protein
LKKKLQGRKYLEMNKIEDKYNKIYEIPLRECLDGEFIVLTTYIKKETNLK